MTAQSSLAELVEQLEPVLKSHGFTFTAEHDAVSSGGPFANGYFVRGPLRIGVIVRGTTLGLPVYELGEYNAGHNDVVRLLGRADDARLQWDPDEYQLLARNGYEPIEAFLVDLSTIVLPALRASQDSLASLLATAHAERLRKFGM